MLVWRIEHSASRVGPFNHETDGPARELSYSTCIPSPWDREAEPYLEPWRRMLDAERHEYIFGFASRSQMRRWFGPELMKALRLLGFTVSLYEVDPQATIPGSAQVAFRKDYATCLNSKTQIRKRRRGRRPRP